MTDSFLPVVNDGWAVLAAGSGSGDEATVPMWATQVDCGNGPVRLALGDGGERRLLIPIAETVLVPEDSAGAALLIRKSRLQVGGTWLQFMDVSCSDQQLFQVFSSITSEILARLSDGESPNSAVSGVLNDFRELLRRPAHKLSRIFLTGLAGELHFLKALVENNPKAIETWTGPGGGRHDFMGEDLSVEVKASLRAAVDRAHISSVDQLDSVGGEDLFLAWYRFEEAGQGGVSIEELIRSIIDTPVDEVNLTDRLAELQLEDWRQIDRLKTFRVRQLHQATYEIADGFPRVTANSFSGGALPDGVISCEYDIDLSHAADFELDQAQANQVVERIAR